MREKVAKIYFRMLQVHNKDWAWLSFAKFEFETRQSSEAARNLFLRCISFHSDSKAVWHEYFKFELLYCAKMRQRLEIITKHSERYEFVVGLFGIYFDFISTLLSNEIDLANKSSEDIWNGQLAWIVYKHGIDNFSDFDFAQQFIKICNQFETAIVAQIKAKIFENLTERFDYLEDYWQLKAVDSIEQYRQQLRGEKIFTNDEMIDMKRRAYEETIEAFKQACYRFDNIKMWSFYCAFRLEDLRTTDDDECVAAKLAEVLVIFDQLWKSRKLSLDLFKEWVRLLYTVGRFDSHIVQRLTSIILFEGVAHWPKDVELHLLVGCLLVKLTEKISEAIVHKFFEEALLKNFANVRIGVEDNDEKVLESHIELWTLYLNWCLKRKAFTKVKKLLPELGNICVRSPRPMGEQLKTKALAIVYHMFGIHKARAYFNEHKHVTPICKVFFEKMFEIERHHGQRMPDDETVDASKTKDLPTPVLDIFEAMVHHFGAEDYRLWLDYIRLVMPVDVAKAGGIYRRALRCLPADKSLLFREECSLK